MDADGRVAWTEAGVSTFRVSGRSCCDIGFLLQEVLDFIIFLSLYYKLSEIYHMKDLNF